MKSIRDKSYSYKHFSDRLWERYTQRISEKDYEELCANPHVLKVYSIENQDHDTQLVMTINIHGRKIPAVYSFAGKKFTTALPWDGRFAE